MQGWTAAFRQLRVIRGRSCHKSSCCTCIHEWTQARHTRSPMIKGIELKQHVHLGLHTKGLIDIVSNSDFNKHRWGQRRSGLETKLELWMAIVVEITTPWTVWMKAKAGEARNYVPFPLKKTSTTLCCTRLMELRWLLNDFEVQLQVWLISGLCWTVLQLRMTVNWIYSY